jgi:hemoglobin
MPFFERLVDEFYRGVEQDPLLLRLYPEPHDLAPARHRLTLFLAQYWGGPTTYSDERGHPRLRGRHMPFAIGQQERDHWLRHMLSSVEASDAPPHIKARMVEYFEMASTHMINAFPAQGETPP